MPEMLRSTVDKHTPHLTPGTDAKHYRDWFEPVCARALRNIGLLFIAALSARYRLGLPRTTCWRNGAVLFPLRTFHFYTTRVASLT